MLQTIVEIGLIALLPRVAFYCFRNLRNLARMSDEEDWDSDSAVDMASVVSSTQSLTSSVLNYEYENGRRYHAFRAGQYFMPNDDQEQEVSPEFNILY